MPRFKATHLLLSLATACVPATYAQSTHEAVPGSLNYVHGQATLNGQPIASNNDLTTPPQQLHAGDVLSTTSGSADLLLAPGALLRIGDNSSVRLLAADPNRTEVRLDSGRANVDVNLVRKNDLLLIDLQNGQTHLLKQGLYTFNAAANTVRVFNGEAEAFPGTDTNTDIKPVKVKEGKQVTFLGTERPKPQSFDRADSQGDLLPWTGPRETNAALADGAIVNRGSDNGSGYAEYAGFYPASGFYAPYAYGGPWAYGYPYGWYGDPYGFWGGPFFGAGFGWYGGYYGTYGGGRIIKPVHHGGVPVGTGFTGHPYSGTHAFSGNAGFHGGGGHR